MKILSLKVLFFSLILLSIFCSVSFLFTQKVETAEAVNWLEKQTGFGTGGAIPKAFSETDKPKDIRVVVAGVINTFLSFLGIIFVVLLVMAGFKWMTAQGREENITEAKEHIVRAIIGLVIIMAAWGITNLVMDCVYGVVSTSIFNVCKQ